MVKRHRHSCRKDFSYYMYVFIIIVKQVAIKYNLIERKDDE